MKQILVVILATLLYSTSTGQDQAKASNPKATHRLMVLDPGHFHAALLQKKMYDNVDPVVYVYAPGGPELEAYLALINKYNTRDESPTHWTVKVYSGPDYFEKMTAEKPGDIVVLAGNNKRKSQYIDKSIEAGINVLADKPMIIEPGQFDSLVNSFTKAKDKKAVLFDVMTERYDFTNILQKLLVGNKEIFGTLQKGSPDKPAIVEKSTHYFLKTVSGAPLIRPAWFYDTHQQGQGLADITTHLVDQVEWKCFSERKIDYRNDIKVNSSESWATQLTAGQFFRSTNLREYPEYLSGAVQDSVLNVFSNGEIGYTIGEVHANVSVDWKVEAEPGSGDTHYSMIKGTKANVIIRQDAETGFQAVLFIEPVSNNNKYVEQVETFFSREVQRLYPGVKIVKTGKGWKAEVPQVYNIGHEQQFALVAGKFMEYLDSGAIPQQEIDYILAKYYTISEALKKAKRR